MAESSAKQGTVTQFHTGDKKTKTGPVFTWSVGVVSSLRNLKRKLSVYLQIMSMFF